MFVALWLVLAGPRPDGLVFGALAAVLATRASVTLLPPGAAPHPLAAVRLLSRVAVATLLGGVDIARRAFDPRLPLAPGMVAVPLRLPPGPRRDAFRALSSLQPGTLPAGLDAEGRLLMHALDTRLPVAADSAATEDLFRRAARG